MRAAHATHVQRAVNAHFSACISTHKHGDDANRNMCSFHFVSSFKIYQMKVTASKLHDIELEGKCNGKCVCVQLQYD